MCYYKGDFYNFAVFKSAFHCAEPLIITSSTSQYDLNNVERDLIIAHTPLSTSNSMVFRLQPVYFLSTSL